MSVLRRTKPKPEINKMIINQRNQETIMMQSKEIKALRQRLEPKPEIDEMIINRRNQETIMMQIEEMEALRQQQAQKEMEISVLTKQNTELEQKNEILQVMVNQQQSYITKQSYINNST